MIDSIDMNIWKKWDLTAIKKRNNADENISKTIGEDHMFIQATMIRPNWTYSSPIKIQRIIIVLIKSTGIIIADLQTTITMTEKIINLEEIPRKIMDREEF